MKCVRHLAIAALVLLSGVAVFARASRKRQYRLPNVNIGQRIIWGTISLSA